MATAAIPMQQTNRRIAPVWHTVGLLFLVCLPIVRDVYRPQTFASHAHIILRVYAPILIFEWALAAYVYWGIRRNGMRLRELVGGRWSRAADVFRDLGLGVAFLFAGLVCLSLVIHVLGQEQSKAISVILPRGAAEMAVWIVITLTAGFVEELVYRGYLQQQFAGFGMPLWSAILAQALIFGAGHAYEGRSHAIAITAFGAVAGAMAAWRRSLRPNMFGHALMDILAAFLRPA
jgi:membrane protease YdiL (CAAX protease family)